MKGEVAYPVACGFAGTGLRCTKSSKCRSDDCEFCGGERHVVKG